MANGLDKLTDEDLLDLIDKGISPSQIASLCGVKERAVAIRLTIIDAAQARQTHRATVIADAIRKRPMPPEQLFDIDNPVPMFVPAPEIAAWTQINIIGDGPLYNEDHNHLLDANVAWLWTNVGLTKGQRSIVGQCQLPKVQGNRWAQMRWAQQLREWFGDEEIDFLITLYAPYAVEADDLGFCSLTEHELYHCGQDVDPFGCPKFGRDGKPSYCVVGHDLEEHVGIMRRYGVGGCAGKSAEFVRLSQVKPEIGQAKIAAACGTCLRV